VSEEPLPEAPAVPARGRLPRRDDELELEITALDPRGGSIGEAEGCRVHLRGGAPGTRVRVQVHKRRGRKVQARTLEVLEPSPDAVEARCSHFGTCGGCTWQDVRYDVQLAELGASAAARIRALPGCEEVPVDPVVGCEDPWRYRNKMDFTFASRRWVEEHEPEGVETEFALGLHVPRQHAKVLDVLRCDIQFAGGDAILASVRRIARAHGLTPWDLREHTGLLRHLVLRKGFATGEVLAYLVTSEEAPELIDPFAAELLAAHPEITTLVQGVTTRLSSVAVGDTERVLHGPGVIHEELGGLRFAISPGSFFQTNTRQAERLFEIVREEALAGGPAPALVWDLYCGGGAIALALAGACGEVVGFEQVPAAVRDARRNAELNDAPHLSFVEGDVLEGLARHTGPAPDLVVLDPPRAGLHPDVVPAVCDLAPVRIVYVSCNLTAALRDLEALALRGWRVARARPVDLFPHTPHLECVFRLERAPEEAG
jgi:23S rRNA (uracil1939-C5)-methyltransferase